ncbi:phage tail protein [Endozoicomonas sp. SM1973]|uniref:Phage tail protein n=1 Tax=Spartinivicinus marinus TaxID=2994442 RepID=A0A853HZ23_9GAMM|nr:phage tail protein [Spartinivicinus marinus]MCX4029639.1 phage tail protein [Spartinivicinus marinus]NYZ66980.1 phage tail protein [Spartinivicinus marinus]
MADTTKDVKESYPLPAFQYIVDIPDMDEMYFSEASGMSVEYETITYKHGMSFITGPQIYPGQISQPTISLKKGVITKGSQLYDWVNNNAINGGIRKDVRISLVDSEGNPVVSWAADNALPTKLEAPSLSADSSDAAVETLELICKKISVEYH